MSRLAPWPLSGLPSRESPSRIASHDTATWWRSVFVARVASHFAVQIAGCDDDGALAIVPCVGRRAPVVLPALKAGAVCHRSRWNRHARWDEDTAPVCRSACTAPQSEAIARHDHRGPRTGELNPFSDGSPERGSAPGPSLQRLGIDTERSPLDLDGCGQQPRREVWSLADAEAPVGAGGQGEKHRPLVAGARPGAGRFSAPLV